MHHHHDVVVQALGGVALLIVSSIVLYGVIRWKVQRYGRDGLSRAMQGSHTSDWALPACGVVAGLVLIVRAIIGL